MNKKAVRINRLQNLVIVALTISALFLLSQTPLFGDLTDQLPRQIMHMLRKDDSPSGSSVQAGLSAFAAPVRVLYTNDYARFGQDALTVLDGSFEPVALYLSEAIGSASYASPIAENMLLSALEKQGIYFSFAADIPLSILAESLGVSCGIERSISVRRALLSPAGSTALLYLADSSGSCFSLPTTVSGSSITEFLNAQSGSGACLSLHIPEEYPSLSPYTLIFSEQEQRCTLNAATPLSDMELSEFLRLAEFNPHTESRYTESSGATVVREGNSSLRFDTSGAITYQGGAAAKSSLYSVPVPEGSKPAMLDAASAAQRLASKLLQDRIGAASLYLSGVAPTKDGYAVTLDYAVSGTPLCFSDGSHAVCITITGQSITEFSLHFRSYALTEETAPLLPLQQAFAIAQNRHKSSEPAVYYVDAGGSTVSPSWIIG